MKDILTTTDVAKLLGLHANTLKNWVREGKLPSFRTLGGHYRIRAEELLEALKEKGIPIPEALARKAREVFVVHKDGNVLNAIEQNLKSEGALSVTSFDNCFEALMSLGSKTPCAIVWDADQKEIDTVSFARTLSGKDKTKNINLILLCVKGSDAAVAPPDGLEGIPIYCYPDQLQAVIDNVRNSLV